MSTKSASGGRHDGAGTLTALIADDHPLILAGVRHGLEQDAAITVVGEARSWPELLSMVERRRPRVVVTDLLMPGLAAMNGIAQLTSTWPDLKVVVLSAWEDQPTIDAAMAAGASAYVVKRIDPIDVASVIKTTAGIAGTPRRPTTIRSRRSQHSPALTRREQTILAAVASGKTTSAISQDLWISEHTIKFHLTNIYRKLGVANRAAAIRYAVDHKLVTR